jgi:hypothetical protein
MIPAKRSRFFNHCRGRRATNAARSGERRRGSSVTDATRGSGLGLSSGFMRAIGGS